MKRQFFFYMLVLLAVCLIRALPHPVGCTPFIAASLFFATKAPRARSLWMFLMPLFFFGTAVFQTGIWQGWWIQPVSLFLVLLLSSGFKGKGVVSYALLALFSSFNFFLISNTGAWIAHALDYPMNFQGWLWCMNMGIPYFLPQLFWDVLFTVLVFGIYDTITEYKFALKYSLA